MLSLTLSVCLKLRNGADFPPIVGVVQISHLLLEWYRFPTYCWSGANLPQLLLKMGFGLAYHFILQSQPSVLDELTF